MKTYIEKTYRYKTKHTKLLEIEGWYDVMPELPEEVKDLYKQWKALETTMKFTKYLARLGLDNKIISETGKMLETTSFKLSCRFNDILRCSESKHFLSCYSEEYGAINYNHMRHILANDPNVAIVYVPDKHGDFLLRSFVRLVKQEDASYALVLIAWYGNGPKEAIFDKLNSIIQTYKMKEDKNSRILYSPVRSTAVVDGKFLGKPWNDGKQFKTKHLKIGVAV